jgi:hypothetical protein
VQKYPYYQSLFQVSEWIPELWLYILSHYTFCLASLGRPFASSNPYSRLDLYTGHSDYHTVPVRRFNLMNTVNIWYGPRPYNHCTAIAVYGWQPYLSYITQMMSTTNFVTVRTLWGKELATWPSNLWFPPVHCENVGPRHGWSEPIGHLTQSCDRSFEQSGTGRIIIFYSLLHIRIVPLFYCIWTIKRAGAGMQILFPFVGHPHHIQSSSRDGLWLLSVLSKTEPQTICVVSNFTWGWQIQANTKHAPPTAPPKSSDIATKFH